MLREVRIVKFSLCCREVNGFSSTTFSLGEKPHKDSSENETGSEKSLKVKKLANDGEYWVVKKRVVDAWG